MGQVGDEAPDAPAPEILRVFFDVMQQLNRDEKLLAYHDRSDGGLFVTLVEMAFGGQRRARYSDALSGSSTAV